MRSWVRARRGLVLAVALAASIPGCKTRSDEGSAPLPKASTAEGSDAASAPLPKASTAEGSDAARPAVLADTSYALTLPRGWTLASAKPAFKMATSDDGDEVTTATIDVGPERFRYVAETRRQSAVHFGGEIGPLKEEVIGGIPALTFTAKQLTELDRDASGAPNIFCAVMRREGAGSATVSVTFYSTKSIELVEKNGREMLKQLRIR